MPSLRKSETFLIVSSISSRSMLSMKAWRTRSSVKGEGCWPKSRRPSVFWKGVVRTSISGTSFFSGRMSSERMAGKV